jgi:hypothetical protein
MIELLANNETESMWKEVAVFKFEAVTQHLLGETQGSHRISVMTINVPGRDSKLAPS